jgi:xylan 1,4-beta-xylosidase
VTTNFVCDCSAPSSPLAHVWEHTIGSGHATLALRADWQAQMRKCREELGFRYVRFHGILCDDMGTFLIYADQPLYSFFNADQIFDFLVSIGMKPFVELSFMPTGLSTGDKIVFHYRANVTPPRDYALWGTLIQKLSQHWVDRYGLEEVKSWFFEVWNEPNLDAFGSGKQDDYFKLYDATSKAIKNVHPELKVGGPATAANAWIPDFLKFCDGAKLPVDFVSTHHYPTDAFGKPGDDTEAQLAASTRSILRQQSVTAAREADGKPVYYTEWSSSSNPRDPMHDEPYAAAFAVKTVMEVDGVVEAYSYWTFSDIFEENYFPSVPFHGGFGLLNIHGIPKPIYRAYQLLRRTGAERLNVEGSHPTVDVWVIRGPNSTTVLLTNYALPRHPIAAETVEINLANLAAPSHATIGRVDDDHANAPAAWKKMGQPEYLSSDQVKELMQVSEVADEPFEFQVSASGVRCTVSLIPQSVTAITLHKSQSLGQP